LTEKKPISFWARFQKLEKTSAGKNAALFQFLYVSRENKDRIQKLIPKKRAFFPFLRQKSVWISLTFLFISSGLFYLINSRVPQDSQQVPLITISLKTPIPYQSSQAQGERLFLYMKPEWNSLPMDERKRLSEQALKEISQGEYSRLILLNKKGEILGIGASGKGMRIRN